MDPGFTVLSSNELKFQKDHLLILFAPVNFTERLFDIYAAVTEDDSELSFDEFLVCVYNYATYDARLLATYIFDIMDVDKKQILSLDECDAMMRLVYYNHDDQEAYKAAKASLLETSEGSTVR